MYKIIKKYNRTNDVIYYKKQGNKYYKYSHYVRIINLNFFGIEIKINNI
jgi:hypothetical protein